CSSSWGVRRTCCADSSCSPCGGGSGTRFTACSGARASVIIPPWVRDAANASLAPSLLGNLHRRRDGVPLELPDVGVHEHRRAGRRRVRAAPLLSWGHPAGWLAV